ncbi:FGGY-family carbohydrate kinase [Vallitaleaceae bacterium 9-2]
MVMEKEQIIQMINDGKTALGIELGSTRIKAVLIDDNHQPIASGGHDWENSLIDGVWTYDLEEVWVGVQDSYQKMVTDVEDKFGVKLSKVGAIGISAMMHGYIVFDQDDQQLVPFRTWRNNITGEASKALTDLFQYPVPQRWSIAHLYQAILNGEEHVSRINYLTTLEGYVHWKLTGEKVLGIGDVAGMFPVDLNTHDYHARMIEQFNTLAADNNMPWKVQDILPKALVAGQDAGSLTREGAKLLDPTGLLQPGIIMCPPEGDAGTGMVATNSVAARTGNVSAGTSVFAMIVLEKELSKVYSEIDLVATPSGKLVAMAHSNNCTSDLNAWVNLFDETLKAFGVEVDQTTLFKTLYTKALEGDADAGGLLSYGYLSGEHMTHFEEGRPLFVRSSQNHFNLANFMRANLYTSLGALKIGLDILLKGEGVQLDKILGHGGLFKTKGVGQRFLSAAVNAPVTVMETAGEGGAWGVALLAAYLKNKQEGETLEQYLDERVFGSQKGETLSATDEDVEGFERFMETYKSGLAIERAAVENHR